MPVWKTVGSANILSVNIRYINIATTIPHPVHLTGKLQRILSKKFNYLVRFGVKSSRDNELGDEV